MEQLQAQLKATANASIDPSEFANITLIEKDPTDILALMTLTEVSAEHFILEGSLSNPPLVVKSVRVLPTTIKFNL